MRTVLRHEMPASQNIMIDLTEGCGGRVTGSVSEVLTSQGWRAAEKQVVIAGAAYRILVRGVGES